MGFVVCGFFGGCFCVFFLVLCGFFILLLGFYVMLYVAAVGIFFGKVFVWAEGSIHLAITEVTA